MVQKKGKLTIDLTGIRLYVLSQCSCCQTDYKTRYGKWAVISGSTDGIGLAMARELARRGHSIVLMGRSEEKLANAKASVESEPNVGEVITVKSDLSDASTANFERIKNDIDPDNREIGILINNAGIFPEAFIPFQSHSMESLRGAVNLNDLAILYLTHMTLPGMVTRGKGLVVNVSSIFGDLPGPFVGAYAPTKAFVNSFSEGLRTEYEPLGVDVINITPGPVFTKQFKAANKIDRASFVNPTAETFARSAINALSTRIASFCGVPMHEFTLLSGKSIKCLGLYDFTLKNSLKFSANRYSFKP